MNITEYQAYLDTLAQPPGGAIRKSKPAQLQIPHCKAVERGQSLGGVIVRIKSHNARHGAQRVTTSMRSLHSTKWCLYATHHAAEGFYLVSQNDSDKLKTQTSRWSRSILWPVRVPADLSFRTGGIFG